MVPLTSCFIITLTWCRRWLITSAWKLSTLVSWSSSTFWAHPGYQLNSWWEISSLPLDDSYCHRPLYCVPSNKNLFVFCVIPRVPCYLAFVLLYHGVLPSFMSRRSWGLLHLLRILGMVILLTLTILSWSSCFQPVTNKWTVLFEFCPSSNPIALMLMVGRSLLDYWLLNHHSDIGRATQPIFRAHLSTNVNCVCFPRAYIIISFDLTNVISLFT